MRTRLLVAGALTLALAGYGVADAADVAPGVLTAAAPVTKALPGRAKLSDPPRTTAAPVLSPVSTTAPRPGSGLATALRPLLRTPALGPRVSAYVADAATGAVLLDDGAKRPMVPASVTKLLTGAAVLTAVGARTRLTTRVVQGAAPDEVVLLGGGDMLLAEGHGGRGVTGHAGLDDLARQVAAKLTAASTTRVDVRFDDSLFAGPNTSPAWLPADVAFGYTGRVAALGLASDRARPGRPSSRDPAATAAAAFGTALRRSGVRVVATPSRTRAPARATVLGRVESAPVVDVLELALLESDNALADVLARLVARSVGRPTTSVSAATAVLEQVREAGVDVGPTRISDASGLGAGSAVPARVLGQVLTLSARPDRPQLRPLLERLPVSGFTGTLAGRFRAPRTRTAAGVVRAKTGTLTGSSTIAGTTVDSDGRWLAFVVMADRVPASGTVAARAALDRIAAALSACGCG